jgi:hypothetical protein
VGWLIFFWFGGCGGRLGEYTGFMDFDVVVGPQVGDELVCPGCGERLRLDWADGWRNDNGFTCFPARTTHSDHIVTLALLAVGEGMD